MSKLISLLKATMSDGVQLFNYKAKDLHSRRKMPILLALLMGVMVLFSALTMTAELRESGGESAILSVYALITTVIILTEGTYKSGDLLFRPRDNDTLLAMPIPKSTIVATRMIRFYVFEMLYCLIFLLPALIAYAVFADVGASYYLVAVTMLILIPVIPIALSCVIGLVISAVSSRFRRKTFWQVILSFVALVGFAVLILQFSTTTDFDERSMVIIGDKIVGLYYPAAALVGLAAQFDLGQYLIFVLINLLILVVTVLLISRFYFRIVTRMSVVKRGESVGEAHYTIKRHSQVAAMVKKELNRYFNTPVLLMNTAIGLVLFLVAVVALCFKYDDIVASLVSSVENFPLSVDEIRSYLPSVAFMLVAFASLMTFITATMISLEGRTINLLKSMPISGVKVIMSKVLAAMILIVPVTLLGSIVMFVRFGFSIPDMILVLVAIVALPLVTELIGIIIDLKYARFDAESDAVTVKQSASVMIATFLGLGMVLVTISLAFAIVFLAGQTAGLIIMDATFAIIAGFLYFAIAMRGDEKYLKLTDLL